jgi:DNA repair protein RecO (recombination protein O)
MVIPNFYDLQWRIGFSNELGGIVSLPLKMDRPITLKRLTAIELSVLQHLSQANLLQVLTLLPELAQKRIRARDWLVVEGVLRDYAQQQLGKKFKSAPLVDSLWDLEF